MTEAEAIAEAQRRWGPHGTAANQGQQGGYVVGVRPDPQRAIHFRGHGRSWEDAFRDADENERRMQLQVLGRWSWRGNELWVSLRCQYCRREWSYRVRPVRPLWEGSQEQRAIAAEALAVQRMARGCEHVTRCRRDVDRRGIGR